MTTATSWLALLAVVVFVSGMVLSLTRGTPRWRLAGMATTLMLAVAIGWIAWFVGVTPAGA